MMTTVRKEVLKSSTVPLLAEEGKRVSAQLSGYLEATRTMFWTTKTTDQPFQFVLGAAHVIKGLDSGCVGMRKGESQRLHVPARLAYGASGFPAFGIPPNAALVFDVEILEIEDDLPKIDLKERFYDSACSFVCGESKQSITVDGAERGAVQKEQAKGILLFMHGFPDDEKVFSDQIDYLSQRGYRCLFYTLPWFGTLEEATEEAERKGYSRWGYSLNQTVDALALGLHAVLEAAKSEDPSSTHLHAATLVAHDWGAFHGQLLKARHPHLVSQSIILDVDFLRLLQAPRLSNIGHFLFLGVTYQYQMMLAHLLSQVPGLPFFPKGNLGDWLVSRMKKGCVQYGMKVPKNSKGQADYSSSGKSGMFYTELQCYGMLRALGLMKPGLTSETALEDVWKNSLYIYGEKKAFMFHTPNLPEQLNTSKRAGFENSCAIGLPCLHWISVEKSDELTDLIVQYLENKQGLLSRHKNKARL